MKWRWFSIALVAVLFFAFSPPKSADAAEFSFSIGFHDVLGPYGTWVNYSNYGNCWRPYGYSNYRPYVDGYWAYSSYGPTWYGNEPWAPYTYNYGYWIYTVQFGWIWVPGDQWHSDDVDWTYGGGYIGWRPRFPAGYNYPGNMFNLWIVIDSNHFGYRDYRPYVYRSSYVQNLWDRHVFRNRYDRLDRTQLERITHRQVPYVNLRERTVRIGNHNARMYVTPDQETRIQRHVEQVRGRGNVRYERQYNQHENVMQNTYNEIRSRSNRNESHAHERQFTRPTKNDHRENNSQAVVRHESRSYEPAQRYGVRRSEPPRQETIRHESVNRAESHGRSAPEPNRAYVHNSYEQRTSHTSQREAASRVDPPRSHASSHKSSSSKEHRQKPHRH